MSASRRRQGSACYRIRLDGHLDDHWSARLGDLTLTREGDGTTTLSGLVSDQAALHGLLMKVRDLGIPLISLAVIDDEPNRHARFFESHGAGERTGRPSAQRPPPTLDSR